MLVLSIQAYYKAYSRCFFNIILFRIVCTENQFHLPLFMINKVIVTLLRQYLSFYCLFKLIIYSNSRCLLFISII